MLPFAAPSPIVRKAYPLFYSCPFYQRLPLGNLVVIHSKLADLETVPFQLPGGGMRVAPEVAFTSAYENLKRRVLVTYRHFM